EFRRCLFRSYPVPPGAGSLPRPGAELDQIALLERDAVAVPARGQNLPDGGRPGDGQVERLDLLVDELAPAALRRAVGRLRQQAADLGEREAERLAEAHEADAIDGGG